MGTTSAITLRIPPALRRKFEERAKAEGTSLNRAVIGLLEEKVSTRFEGKPTLHHDLDHLAGRWSVEEAREFDKRVIGQRKIDKELWE